MAKLDGGIFSRPRGKTGGIVFGAARTRQGKVVTSRLLVPPSNPNTPAQQDQRSIFRQALDIVREIGSSFYRADFNRSVSQLPGFQSLMSVFMNNMDDNQVLSPPPEINLGSLPAPQNVSAEHDSVANTLTINWSTEIEGQASGLDRAVVIVAGAQPSVDDFQRPVLVDNTPTRADGQLVLNVDHGIDIYIVGLYFRDPQNDSESLSNAKWVQAVLL